MMDGFTPTFLLEVLIAVGSAGAVYGAIKTDLKNMHLLIADEKRLREEHAKEDDKSIHELRDGINTVGMKVAALEGERRAA